MSSSITLDGRTVAVPKDFFDVVWEVSWKSVITIEDGAITGGFGSAVFEFMIENGYSAKIKRLGIPDKFIEHGTQKELYNLCGYDTDGIYNTVKEMKKLKK